MYLLTDICSLYSHNYESKVYYIKYIITINFTSSITIKYTTDYSTALYYRYINFIHDTSH